MAHATHTIAAVTNVVTITAMTAEAQADTLATLNQISLLTLTTQGATGNEFTATLDGTGISYTLIAADDTLAKQATKLANAINSNSNYTSSSLGAVISITGSVTGPVTFTTAFSSTGSTTGVYTGGATAGVTITPATTTDGVDAQTLQDTFVVDFKNTDAPASVSFEFASGLTTAQAAAAIAAFSNSNAALSNTTSGVLMEVDNTFVNSGGTALASGAQRIKWTYRQAGDDTNTLTTAATVTGGMTNGTLATSSVVTITPGEDASVTGTLDTWSVTIDGTEYTGTFSTTAKPLGGLTANEQAAEIARFLNAV